MNEHLSVPPFETDDGWWAACECGYQNGPFLSMEAFVDDLMKHVGKVVSEGGKP